MWIENDRHSVIDKSRECVGARRLKSRAFQRLSRSDRSQFPITPANRRKLVSIDFKKMSLLRLEPSAAHRNRSPRFVLHALASWFGSRDGFIDSLLSFSPGQE
jgi:hypothetical protein